MEPTKLRIVQAICAAVVGCVFIIAAGSTLHPIARKYLPASIVAGCGEIVISKDEHPSREACEQVLLNAQRMEGAE